MSLEQMFTAWLQGEDDPVANEELQRWLRAEPEHRQWARNELAFHLALRARLQSADAGAVATLIDEVGVGRTGVRTTQRLRVTRTCRDAVERRRRDRWRTAMIALAAGLLLVVGAATYTSRFLATHSSQHTAPSPVIAQRETPIGWITALSGATEVERAGQRRVLVAGEALQAGDRVIAAAGATISWRGDAAELELRQGECQLRPRADTDLAVNAGQLRVVMLQATSHATPLRLIAGTAAIETDDASVWVTVNRRGTLLDVERGQAVITQGGSRHVVTSAKPIYNDASGAYRVLFHFDQATAERDPHVAYGDPQADSTAPDGWSLRGVMLDDSREVYLEDAGAGLLTLEPGAELRITYRIAGHGPLRVFAHNSDLHIDTTAELGVVTGSEWHTAIIRLTDFHNQGPLFDQPGAFSGNRLRNLIIASDQPQTLTELSVDEVLCVAPALP